MFYRREALKPSTGGLNWPTKRVRTKTRLSFSVRGVKRAMSLIKLILRKLVQLVNNALLIT